MSFYFCDSSALVKRYISESGTSWITGITTISSGNRIFIAEITSVEIVSAIARRKHAGTISPRMAKAVRLLVDRHYQRQYQKVRLSRDVVLQAENLLEKYQLRAADAIQLASALEVQHAMSQGSLPAPIFICADQRLLAAAIAEGLQTDDPNLHP